VSEYATPFTIDRRGQAGTIQAVKPS
jgi:hypothetical protein